MDRESPVLETKILSLVIKTILAVQPTFSPILEAFAYFDFWRLIVGEQIYLLYSIYCYL